MDLRPTVVNAYAARALGTGRATLLGRPLGELVVQGVEELEGALQHVLAEGAPASPAELWVTLRTAEGERRRCWRSGFLRLSSPLAEEPVPLGVGWLFQDVTDAKLAEQDADRLRFRSNQLHRASRSAAECEDPMEAATSHLDFALAGFADHALVDLAGGGAAGAGRGDPVRRAGPGRAGGGRRHPGPLSGGPPRAPGGGPAGSVRDSAGARRARAWARGAPVAPGRGARPVRGAAQPRPDPGRR